MSIEDAELIISIYFNQLLRSASQLSIAECKELAFSLFSIAFNKAGGAEMKAKTMLEKLQQILNDLRTHKTYMTGFHRTEILATLRAIEGELL